MRHTGSCHAESGAPGGFDATSLADLVASDEQAALAGGDRKGITLASRAPLCVVPFQGMNGATAGQLTGAPLGGRGGEWQK